MIDARKTPLFRSADGRTGTLTDQRMSRTDVFRMVKRRGLACGIGIDRICCHTFRATGITAYLENGGTIEHAQAIAAHESPRTTKHYDRTNDALTRKRQPELLEELISEIEQKLAAAPGLRLVLDWEQFVHQAVCASGDLLADVAGTDEAIMALAAALVDAAGGVGDSESETAARFFEAVNPILLDSIKIGNQTEIAKADHFGALHKLAAAAPKLSPEHCAAINRVLLTAVVEVGQTCVAQGNLYLKDGWEATGTPFPMMVDAEAIRLELYELFAFRAHRDDPDKKKKTVLWKERMGAISAKVIPCAVEISPGCDYAQKKAVYARVLGGLLVPDDGKGPLTIPAEVRAYAKQLPLFQIKDERLKIDGRYSLVLNARHLVTPTPDALKKMQPLLRIREAVAVDIQAWFSGHAGRAGFVSLW